MTQEEVLGRVLESLERHGVAFMVTGSLAGNLHGLPRATQDADVVIEGGWLQIDRFVAALGGAFYANRDAARDAFQREGMFNVIHLETGMRVATPARQFI